MRTSSPHPAPLAISSILMEGVSLLPRAVGPYLRLALAAIGLFLLLLLVLYLLPYTLWVVVLTMLEIGGLPAISVSRSPRACRRRPVLSVRSSRSM